MRQMVTFLDLEVRFFKRIRFLGGVHKGSIFSQVQGQIRFLDDVFYYLYFNICEIRASCKFRYHIIFKSLTTNVDLIKKPVANQFTGFYKRKILEINPVLPGVP